MFSLVVGISGWRKAHWLLRTMSVLAVVFTVVAAFTVVNQNYDYYPTLDRLFGKEAANFAALPQLQAIRDQVRRTGHLPDHGETVMVHIPPTNSHFDAADAYVYVPPVWFKNPEPALPMIELLNGVPGQPSDWTRAGYADSTSTVFAEHHGGVSPLLVIPDPNGPAQDTECVNSKLGNAETYLSIDVPNYMRSEFNAAAGARSLAVAGLSAGGTCSIVLSLRNPKIYTAFGDYSGFATQTYLNDGKAGTVATLFNGSNAAYEAYDPTTLLTRGRYTTLSGWFGAGLQDPQSLAAAKQLHGLSKGVLAQTCILLEPGGHDFTYWTEAFAELAALALVEAGSDAGAHRQQGDVHPRDQLRWGRRSQSHPVVTLRSHT